MATHHDQDCEIPGNLRNLKALRYTPTFDYETVYGWVAQASSTYCGCNLRLFGAQPTPKNRGEYVDSLVRFIRRTHDSSPALSPFGPVVMGLVSRGRQAGKIGVYPPGHPNAGMEIEKGPKQHNLPAGGQVIDARDRFEARRRAAWIAEGWGSE